MHHKSSAKDYFQGVAKKELYVKVVCIVKVML